MEAVCKVMWMMMKEKEKSVVAMRYHCNMITSLLHFAAIVVAIMGKSIMEIILDYRVIV